MSSDTLNHLYEAGKDAIKAVMGPDHAKALHDLLSSHPDALKALSAAAMKATTDGIDGSDFIQKLQDIQEHLIGGKAEACSSTRTDQEGIHRCRWSYGCRR